MPQVANKRAKIAASKQAEGQGGSPTDPWGPVPSDVLWKGQKPVMEGGEMSLLHSDGKSRQGTPPP